MNNSTIELNGKKYIIPEEVLQQYEVNDSPYRKPKKGEEYYFYNDWGDLDYCLWDGDNADEARYKFGNTWLDEATAKKDKAIELLNRKLRAFSDMNGGDQIDWKDCCQDKYYVVYHHDTKQIGYAVLGSIINAKDGFATEIISHVEFIGNNISKAVDLTEKFCKTHPELGYEV